MNKHDRARPESARPRCVLPWPFCHGPFVMVVLLWSFCYGPWGRFDVLKKLTPRGAITHEVSRLKKDFGPAVSELKSPAADSADLPVTAPELAAEISHWLSHLGAERRLSEKTV